MIINRLRIKININVFFYLISCLFLSLATTNIDRFLTKKFVKTKKFEKKNIMAGFRQLYLFSTWVPNTRDF